MVTREQALAWLNGSHGGSDFNPAILLRRQEAIVARARLVYAQGQHQKTQRQGQAEDNREPEPGPSRRLQSPELRDKEPLVVSSDAGGMQPDQMQQPDDSTQADFASFLSASRPTQRLRDGRAIATQTQNVTSVYSSSRLEPQLQASEAEAVRTSQPRLAGTGFHWMHSIFTVQQETQDITDPSISMSPRKVGPQPSTTTSAGSAIASSLRPNAKPMTNKSRMVKFNMLPSRASGQNDFSATTNITTPADTASVMRPSGSGPRSMTSAMREELLHEDLSSERSRNVDLKGKGKARENFEEEFPRSHRLMHSTPIPKTHGKGSAIENRLAHTRIGPGNPSALTDSNSLTSVTSTNLSTETGRGGERETRHGRFITTTNSGSASRFRRTTSASDVTIALRRSRVLGSEGELAQWDDDQQLPADPSSSPIPLHRGKGRKRKESEQEMERKKSIPVSVPLTAGHQKDKAKVQNEETDLSEQEREIQLLPLGEERIRKAKELQAKRDKRRLAARREREREREQEKKAAALAVPSNLGGAQPPGKRPLQFSTSGPARAISASGPLRATKSVPGHHLPQQKPGKRLPSGPRMLGSSRIADGGAISSTSSEVAAVQDALEGGGETAHKKRKLALADTSVRSGDAVERERAASTDINEDGRSAQKRPATVLAHRRGAEEAKGSEAVRKEPDTSRVAVLDRARAHSATAKAAGRGRGRGRGRGSAAASKPASTTTRKRG
ncbi:hypothetical protein CF319_g5453 [Tilletia indica]|nr:hypothetical protein CF319_g5453 [Tilletia indica]KAE8232689.1 hypothetical protein CF326_g2278 [Tilletia indica]